MYYTIKPLKSSKSIGYCHLVNVWSLSFVNRKSTCKQQKMMPSHIIWLYPIKISASNILILILFSVNLIVLWMSIIINRPVEERHSFLYAKQRVKLFYNLEHLQSTCGNPLATMAMRLSISSCLNLIISLQNTNGVCLCCPILEAP
jgi:hypothetical protein